ncbi:ComEC/Rec2 family competence protein [Romboutsia sp.]|uniref:ComEC/Rec2 family competence protein n=1 Tax=Romboutsia sp. TaxID=1965302 RepID=UPI002BFEB1D7|nr:ComEC/Rec2 family competence protein [Romboutsia sp.]HSQ88189.1 ComEC/Rec2 family competence protein [Romboutsia sp.]
MKIHIIDVGQGDSILIQTPNTKNILVDGGTDDSEHIVKSYLKKQKVKYIDYVIATHPDSDHIGGLDSIIKKFQVKSIYMPEQSTDSLAYKNLVTACSDKNIAINYLYKGDILNIEEYIDLLVLSPSFIQHENNLNSIVFKLDFKNKSFLFTGDAELSTENDVINSFQLEDVDFLKVAHHGSSSSTSMNFLSETTPDVAVISCGYKNQYGHPHRSTLDNLSNSDIITYRTDLSGDMVFYSDGETIYTKKNYEYIK